MSWLIKALRYILFSGGSDDDEEPDGRQDETFPAQWRSHPSPPVIRSQQSHPPPPPRPPPSPAAKPTAVSVNPSPPARLSTSFVAFRSSPSPLPAPAAATRVSPTIPPPQPSCLPATKPPGPHHLSPAAKPPSVFIKPSPPPRQQEPPAAQVLPNHPLPSPSNRRSALSWYEIPENLFNKDKLPPVLRGQLTPSTYTDYSAFINPSPRPRWPQEPLTAQPSSVIPARLWVVKRSPLPSDSPPSSPSFGDGGSPKPSPSSRRSALSRYQIPEDLKELFNKDKLPPVLRGQLTPSTYTDYFAALLYAEDYYAEKWSKFLLDEVMLELRSRSDFEASRETKKTNKSTQMNKKDFVAFEIDSVPERRPYLLSRDFVIVRPLGKKIGPFKGVIFRVVKSRMILVEFEDDFHAQHSSNDRYDVSFSFNRVCLKRAHCAVSAAKDPTFLNLLFPDASGIPSLSYPTYFPTYGNPNQNISLIINHTGPQPYLIEGPRSITIKDGLSTAGSLIREAILQIFETVAHSRILICSPENRTCDVLMRSLQEIPKWKLFRANAAFRDYDDVPDDIIRTCLYEGECFSCPPLSELQEFKVITSTFMSSYRLHSAGLGANHFTHIFLVDASSATEPEAIVTLTNLAGRETAVVVTGSQKDPPFRMRVRSDIGRRYGLTRSYFHRLLKREPYLSCHPNFFTRLKE